MNLPNLYKTRELLQEIQRGGSGFHFCYEKFFGWVSDSHACGCIAGTIIWHEGYRRQRIEGLQKVVCPSAFLGLNDAQAHFLFSGDAYLDYPREALDDMTIAHALDRLAFLIAQAEQAAAPRRMAETA